MTTWFGLILWLSAGVTPFSSSVLPQVEVQLGQFADEPGLAARVLAVRQRTWQYERLFQRADSLGQALDLTVDIIGQIHRYDQETEAEHLEMLASQRRVYHLLDSLDYELIGSEGTSREKITIDSLTVTIRRSLDFGFGTADSSVVVQVAEIYRQDDGVLAWLWDHPTSHVVGVEDHSLNQLHGAVINRVWRGQHPSLRTWLTWYVFEGNLSRLRSEMALAKTIVAMAASGYHHGVIVIGTGHAADFIGLRKKYHVAGRYWPAD